MADFCGGSRPVLLGIPVDEDEAPGAFNFEGNRLLSFPTMPALGADKRDFGLVWAVPSGDGIFVDWNANSSLFSYVYYIVFILLLLSKII